MVDGINLNDELNRAQIDKQLGSVSGVVTNPINNPYKNTDKNLLIDETAISNEAINLYQRDQDISNFSKLAMSDPQDLSHEEIIANLFDKGVNDPFSDQALQEVAGSQRLLDDLSL